MTVVYEITHKNSVTARIDSSGWVQIMDEAFFPWSLYLENCSGVNSADDIDRRPEILRISDGSKSTDPGGGIRE